jgi:Ser-tRNA(Ala) deacylase AlaX|tara:strand:+ start:194 stop:466 length:273 start_codon:yes stop_codon:yes gene_type:complete
MKKSILNAINSISSTEEMNEVINLIKLKQRQLRDVKAFSIKASLNVGDTVSVNGRHGKRTGVIEKIKVKKAIVRIDGGLWDCPLTLLEAV